MKNLTKSLGKEIAEIKLLDDALHFIFSDKTGLVIRDEASYCCEARYMTTDDDIGSFAGAKLLGMEVKDAPRMEQSEDYDHDVHEVQFLEIQTSKGVLTMANHNEHNGYYSGFDVEITEELK